ncbi:hypothetical protein PIB30_042509 [Stylosanthes scabra]|uniref:Uncharacterized protein n=1 Tax=Stylosanthes scabra TaxID=79078 RepID=A0ABU6SF58_9FABA|nr:hypothetical protein [Stylosanthes scabra]
MRPLLTSRHTLISFVTTIITLAIFGAPDILLSSLVSSKLCDPTENQETKQSKQGNRSTTFLHHQSKIKTAKSKGTMATKTMAKKQKGGGKKKQYNKSNRTRCSPSDVAELLEKLSSEQKAVVRDMGFGALENLSILNISKKIMIELVDSFNTNDNSMRTTLGRIKPDASKIGHALGLNARGNTYEKKNRQQKTKRRA